VARFTLNRLNDPVCRHQFILEVPIVEAKFRRPGRFKVDTLAVVERSKVPRQLPAWSLTPVGSWKKTGQVNQLDVVKVTSDVQRESGDWFDNW